MTREEAKRRAELYSALAEGKTIQYKSDHDEWVDLKMDLMCGIAESYKYRIKPEPKYRPFKSQEECWDEMHNHPDFGWVKRVQEPAYLSLNNIEEIGRVDGWDFSDIFKHITFTDGEPFGVKEE